jgi:hypothetical protein
MAISWLWSPNLRLNIFRNPARTLVRRLRPFHCTSHLENVRVIVLEICVIDTSKDQHPSLRDLTCRMMSPLHRQVTSRTLQNPLELFANSLNDIQLIVGNHLSGPIISCGSTKHYPSPLYLDQRMTKPLRGCFVL